MMTVTDQLSPDTLSFPPRNQLILPLRSSQSRTRWNGFTHRSLSVAAEPQNRSGSVTDSRYSSRYDSWDSCELHVPGGVGEVGEEEEEERHRWSTGPVRQRLRRKSPGLLLKLTAMLIL